MHAKILFEEKTSFREQILLPMPLISVRTNTLKILRSNNLKNIFKRNFHRAQSRLIINTSWNHS